MHRGGKGSSDGVKRVSVGDDGGHIRGRSWKPREVQGGGAEVCKSAEKGSEARSDDGVHTRRRKRGTRRRKGGYRRRANQSKKEATLKRKR